tara:strand:+ start:906 stop:1112 length:207 start_codon:yes stop_codon:yes gene_type:complete
MINYCIDYFKVYKDWVDEGTMIASSCTERENNKNLLIEEGYTIADIYENEDCYCSARYENECACGNFK